MAGYPTVADERHVSYEDLLAVVVAIFRACGMDADDGHLVAESLALADLRGVHSHGTLRVGEYVLKLETGVDPKGRPRVARESGAALVIDGANAMGQVACAFAMRRAIERARGTGVAFAAVGGSNHAGAMAYYAMLAAAEDMIGLAATNALPTMAPWGGIDKIVGINPLAVAIPVEAAPAIVYDAAFSGSSHGKLRVHAQKRLPIPPDWAFDEQGRPTTDATAALTGLLQPIGGFKGIGLATVMGLLSTLLAGAGYGTRLGNMVDGPIPGRDGQFCMALDIAAFTDLAGFKRAARAALDEVHGSRRKPGVERLYMPGELEAVTEARRRVEGIPLNAETLAGIIEAAARRGVDASALQA